MPAHVRVVWSDQAGPGRADRLVRHEVSREFDIPERVLRLVRLCPSCGSAEHGRPLLVPLPGLRVPHVSISHAGMLTVVALSLAAPVGVDVERAGAAGFPGFPAVALHPAENAASAHERSVTWVRKESLLKATGQGLVPDLTTIRLTGPTDPPRLLGWHGAGAPPTARMWDLETAPGHVASVTVLTDAALSLVVRKAEPAARSPLATR